MSGRVEIPGRIGYAQRPPWHRRWMVTNPKANMGLGNVSLPRAVRYALEELARGNGWSRFQRTHRQAR